MGIFDKNSKTKKNIKTKFWESIDIGRIHIVSEKRVPSQNGEVGLPF